MSRNENHLSKLITTVGVVGLAISLCAPKVRAGVSSFSNANYTGRYACSAATTATGTTNGDFITAVIKYNPNGSGAYSAGTLIAALNDVVTGPVSPSAAFCIFNLDVAASSYTINPDGTGFESLTWTPESATNPPGCPTTAFLDETAIALRNIIATDGSTIRAEFSSANLLGEDEGGHGYCLK